MQSGGSGSGGVVAVSVILRQQQIHLKQIAEASLQTGNFSHLNMNSCRCDHINLPCCASCVRIRTVYLELDVKCEKYIPRYVHAHGCEPKFL